MAAKAEKFNLMDLLNQRSKQKQEAEEQHPAAVLEVSEETPEENVQQENVFKVDVYDLIPSKENFYHVDDTLKHSIELVGILQPCLVKKSSGRKYRVIAGHRRRLAAMALTEEGKEQFRYVPCVLQKDAIQRGVNNEIIDKLELILANGFRDKTDFEKMTEIMELKEIAKELKKEYSLSGRVREWQLELIQLLGIPGAKAAQISRYEAIYNNLEKELMQEFKNERLIFSVAAEVAGMEREWQLRAYDKLLENGELSLAEVKQMKKQIEAEKQCPEQMELPDMQEKDPEDETEPETAGEEQEEETEQSEPAPQEEWIDPEPETVEALCYSCDKYEVCHEKKSTVTKCNAYVNRKEARLTEEEKYNREQAAIDRETKKKLQKKAQEEKMQNLPGDTKKKKYVRISRTQYEEMEGGKKPYIILKSAEHFNAGDIITAQVFEDGRSTGEVMDLYITCIDDENTSSAINSGYVIVGILKKEVAADLGLLEDVEE